MDSGTDSDERTIDAAPSDPTGHSKIGYRRLRVPRQHGTRLQVPPLSSVDQIWKSNLGLQQSGSKIGAIGLAEIQKLGRAEVVELATRYTQTYLEIDLGERSSEHLLLAGHQPELFHPGVWYKNFVLSELGERFNCLAINLIVDNDICGNALIRYPSLTQDHVSVGAIPIIGPGPNVPYEARLIDDENYFAEFQHRVLQAMDGVVDSPIVTRLWPQVVDCSKKLSAGERPRLGRPRLGQSLAAGRHCLEHEIGLRSLEVPVSWIAGSRSFAILAKSILVDLERFQSVYNESLIEYRTVHRIRSRSHPVPELERIEGWRESPFWVWHSDGADRRRLFSKQDGERIWLSDMASWESEFDCDSFVEEFCRLGSQGIAVRPKALMTTMFSRMVLSDLFLHGIGGAKYDQLTDVIASRFFAVKLPEFLTLSATMKLPTKAELTRREDIVRINRQIRELKYHPETEISNPSDEAIDLIQQKRNWTIGEHRNERSREKHLAIESLNHQLQRHVDVQTEDLELARNQAAKKIRATEILDSREYSFCLFPDSLIDELKKLARV